MCLIIVYTIVEPIVAMEIRTMGITVDENQEGYFKGDKVRMTGRKDENTYSFPMVEFVFIDGRFVGEKIWQPGKIVGCDLDENGH